MGVFLLKPEIKSIVFRIANMHRLLGAGAGAVSWLCTWWRQVAGAGGGAGCRVPALVLLAVRVVETVPVLGAGSARGRDSGRRCRCCELAVRVVETGRRCWVLAVCRVCAGCWVYRCWVLVLGAVSWRAGARCWCPLLTVK